MLLLWSRGDGGDCDGGGGGGQSGGGSYHFSYRSPLKLTIECKSVRVKHP